METIRIEEIKVGRRFRQDLGDLQRLVSSIRELGLLQPVVVDENANLIAGQRRLEACKLLGWTEIPVNKISLQQILLGEFAENEDRKAFSFSEKAAILRALAPAEEQKAEERKKAGIPSSESDKGRSDDAIAKSLNTSRDTVRKIKTINNAVQENPEKFADLPRQIDTGEKSINAAVKVVRGETEKPKRKIFKLESSKFEQVIQALQKARDANEAQIEIQVEGSIVVGVGNGPEIPA